MSTYRGKGDKSKKLSKTKYFVKVEEETLNGTVRYIHVHALVLYCTLISPKLRKWVGNFPSF
jgi:hypothetical protein